MQSLQELLPKASHAELWELLSANRAITATGGNELVDSWTWVAKLLGCSPQELLPRVKLASHSGCVLALTTHCLQRRIFTCDFSSCCRRCGAAQLKKPAQDSIGHGVYCRRCHPEDCT